MIDFMAPYNWAVKEWREGIRELAGALHNKRILWYHSFTTLRADTDEVPWCSSFMNAAAFSTGFKGTKLANARSWLGYGVKGSGEVGDIVIFKRGANPASGHVAFVHEHYTPGQKLITVLGGNQNNSVCVSKYKAEDILEFRRFV